MTRESNLLFGVLAVRLGKLDTTQLGGFVVAWKNPSKDLRARLIEAGTISENDARDVARLADLTIQAYDSPTAALDAFAGCAAEPGRSPVPAKIVRGTLFRDALSQAGSLEQRLLFLPHFETLCRMVAAAHGRGIVHRALHPGNVLIGENGETVIRDWSLHKVRGREDVGAALFERAIAAVRNGERIDAAASPSTPPGNGTDKDVAAFLAAVDFAYLPPELALGRLETVDARTDVYALGAVLYTMLTGKAPFSGKTPAEILANVASRKPEPVAVVEPTAPADLAMICERAMHQEPSARYASARHLLDEVRRAMFAPALRGPEPAAPAGATPVLRIAFVILVVALAGVLFCYASVASRWREALSGLNGEREARIAAEQDVDEAVRERDEARQARRDVESERERIDGARIQAQAALKQAEQNMGQLKRAQARVQTVVSIPEASLEEPGTPGPPAPEKPAAPAPPMVVMGSPDTSRPPGLTRAELAEALPELSASLEAGKTAGDKPQVIVRIPGEVPEGLQRMGFKDGDIITNVNRTAVDAVEQARKALDGVKNDAGFTVRIVRDGQSSWMRVNVIEAMPAPAPAQPARAQPAPPAQKEGSAPAGRSEETQAPAEEPKNPEASPADEANPSGAKPQEETAREQP